MTDFMALFKIFGPYQFVKNLFAKIILKKKNLKIHENLAYISKTLFYLFKDYELKSKTYSGY